MKTMVKNEKSYPTIGDLIKNKDYDYVEYRVTIPSADRQDDIFAGAFRTESGKIIPPRRNAYTVPSQKKVLHRRPPGFLFRSGGQTAGKVPAY